MILIFFLHYSLWHNIVLSQTLSLAFTSLTVLEFVFYSRKNMNSIVKTCPSSSVPDEGYSPSVPNAVWFSQFCLSS